MGIDQELTKKSAKNTKRWWKLTATIGCRDKYSRYGQSYFNVQTSELELCYRRPPSRNRFSAGVHGLTFSATRGRAECDIVARAEMSRR